jgi:hypothetical protein
MQCSRVRHSEASLCGDSLAFLEDFTAVEGITGMWRLNTPLLEGDLWVLTGNLDYLKPINISYLSSMKSQGEGALCGVFEFL